MPIQTIYTLPHPPLQRFRKFHWCSYPSFAVPSDSCFRRCLLLPSHVTGVSKSHLSDIDTVTCPCLRSEPIDTAIEPDARYPYWMAGFPLVVCLRLRLRPRRCVPSVLHNHSRKKVGSRDPGPHDFFGQN